MLACFPGLTWLARSHGGVRRPIRSSTHARTYTRHTYEDRGAMVPGTCGAIARTSARKGASARVRAFTAWNDSARFYVVRQPASRAGASGQTRNVSMPMLDDAGEEMHKMRARMLGRRSTHAGGPRRRVNEPECARTRNIVGRRRRRRGRARAYWKKTSYSQLQR